jgi:pimeloyl-ACP methyl ester carboxylesterase
MTTETHAPRPAPSTPSVPATDAGSSPRPSRRVGIGRVVAGSLVTGLVAAGLLAAAPFVPVEEGALTGAVLTGFAIGWAMLAVLSARYTDQPQRWAAAPATLMGVGGVALLAFGPAARELLAWVWPPALLVVTVWMWVGVRRQLGSRAGRVLLYPLTAMLALAAVGGGYETVREAADTRALAAPGQLVDVGGRSLHVHCTGSGSPTVLLQPGAGASSSNLAWITPAVAQDTRVCVYDRAGRGWSDPANTPQDATLIADDLHTLLQEAGIPGPYVLAGHSFGGLYSLTFAHRYPDQVAGMVLIDSTAPASAAPASPTSTSTEEAASSDLLTRASALLSISGRLGLARLYAEASYGEMPAAARDELRATTSTAENLRSTIDEYVQAGASTREAAALVDFGSRPLFVVTAGTGSSAGWGAKQDHLAALSTDSVHRVVDGATHDMLLSDEAAAAVTSAAIRDVMQAVRHDRPLSR